MWAAAQPLDCSLGERGVGMTSSWDQLLSTQPLAAPQMSHNLSSQPQYAPASPCRMQSPPDWPSAAAEGASTAGPCCSYWPPDVSQQHENLAQICAVCCLPASNATRNLQGVLCCRACIPAWRKQQDVLPNSADKALLQQTQQRVQHHAIARPSLQEDLLVDECLQQHQTYQLSGTILLAPYNSEASSGIPASCQKQPQHSYLKQDSESGSWHSTEDAYAAEASCVHQPSNSMPSAPVPAKQQVQNTDSWPAVHPCESAAQLAPAAAAAATVAAAAASEAARSAAAAVAVVTSSVGQKQQQQLASSNALARPELQHCNLLCLQEGRSSSTQAAGTYGLRTVTTMTTVRGRPTELPMSTATAEADAADDLLVEKFMQDVAIKIDPAKGKFACTGLNVGYAQMLATRLAPYLVGLRSINLSYNHQLGDQGLQVLTQQATQLWGGLRALQLSGCSLGAPALLHLHQLGQLQQLEALGLAYNNLGDGGVINLATVCAAQWPQLQVLDLSHCCLTEAGVMALAANGAMHMMQLKSLDLSENSIGDDGLTALGQNAAPHWRQLTSLDLSMTGISGKGFAGFVQSGACYMTGLNRLNLSNNEHLGAVGAAALVRAAPLWSSLTQLDLSYCGLGEEGAGVLGTGAAPHWQNLAVLNLTANEIGDRGLTSLSVDAAPYLGQLKKLTLNCNNIGDVGMSAFAQHGLCYMQWSLNTLQLSRNSISAMGIAALASSSAVQQLRQLQVLVLDYNPLGDSGMMPLFYFGQIDRFPALQELHVHGCELSAANAAGLAAQLPHLQLALGADEDGDVLMPDIVFPD